MAASFLVWVAIGVRWIQLSGPEAAKDHQRRAREPGQSRSRSRSQRREGRDLGVDSGVVELPGGLVADKRKRSAS